MSTDAVTQFLSKMAQDGALQERAKSIAQGNDDTAAAAARLGSEHGFDFTAAEFTRVIEAVGKRRGGQLSDAELEGVTGGAYDCFLKIIDSDAGGIFLGETELKGER